MTNEERNRQIQSDLDYQTLIMLQQQAAQEEDFDEPSYNDHYLDRKCDAFGGALGFSNRDGWVYGNIFLEALLIGLWYFNPADRMLLFVLNVVTMLIYNLIIICLVKTQE